ncbi:site-specific tyrosine recombinase/integron integrase [Ferroplasma sp.]|uniref:site-specific tyrosine recombinase/integron integrase n=1 Tax=Ferroplasma sp. TaxID=2591003 RepID=UPI002628FE36|nr:site-specific tyrosine recombinase/integron integrase [Ferroplasma sp.]
MTDKTIKIRGDTIYTKMDIEKELRSFERFMITERKSFYTIKEYKFLISGFLSYCNKDIFSINFEDIENYKNFIVTEKNYSKASQYLAMKALKLYYKFKNTEIPPNLVPPRRSQKMPVYLNQRDAGILLNGSSSTRDRAIISVFLYTGLRVSELVNLEIGDADFEENIIYVHAGKGDKDRIVVMPDICKEQIKDYIKERIKIRSNNNYLFLSNKKTKFNTSTVERMVKRVAEKSGITKKVTPHVLRHTFATSILRNGGDIRFIQQILGHSSLATTQIYTHIDDSTLKEMYSQHMPKY